jgi:polysaccharide pyruvyl transferase WcaK-like protein
MHIIQLDEQTACQAHATITGNETQLAKLVDETQHKVRAEPVTWQVPVTHTNVHYIESLLMLADEVGCQIDFKPSVELSARELAFFEDVVRHRGSQHSNVTQGLTKRFSELAGFAWNCIKVVLRMGPALLADKPSTNNRALKRVTLIGVYGGEHVGDIAILGGVLFRLHKQFGVTEARLFSHQPEYTSHLTACLDTPVKLTVLPDRPDEVNRVLNDTDALIWAGGPLMDLPPVLVKQLAAIYKTRKLGIPFLLEGVGVGPFRRAPSRWVARKIAQSAARINVRTQGAARDPILNGIEVNIGRDPAFDYLETRQELTRLTPEEQQSADRVLENTQNRIRIGINIRPIRHFWSTQGEAYSRAIEKQFMSNLAESMRQFSAASSQPVSYIFFPMNLIQIGYSDLAAAYRLQNLVGKDVDLHVWEADPDVDAVLYLIRNLDAAITMRFHASIFALSQALPTIGIDYYPGVGGKVEQLFQDRRLADDVRRMDTAETDWLLERLQEKCGNPKTQSQQSI